MLIDDARDAAASNLLFRSPRAIFEARSLDQIAPALAQVRNAFAAGHHVAGYLAYEAGAALNPKIPARDTDERLLWFGAFEAPELLSSAEIAQLLPGAHAAWLGPLRPRPSAATHQRRIEQVKALITAGDIYQANLTFMADLTFAGDPFALYGCLRAAQRAAHSALISTGDEMILSLSPELFFAVEGNTVRCRPMKGTMPHHGARDVREAAAELASDPKQRAENLMIVDLMRNDLARIAEPGSVAVPELFAVERYPTVLQLVSSVEARKRRGADAVAVLEALFPCGSITGAPKVRAMQVIGDLEDGPRGIYTGAIGHIAPGGDARFNVAIRTLRHAPGTGRMTIGLGSGIVADSDPAGEWAECLVKAQFLDAARRDLDLIETMAYDPEIGLRHRDHHLARLARSAAALGFACDPVTIGRELDAALDGIGEPRRVRLVLAASGAVTVEIADVPAAIPGPVPVGLMTRATDARDFRLMHKTSDRSLYRWPAPGSGAFEYLLVDEHGYLTEGSFTNLFVERGGVLVTPPLSRGLLPGVLRSVLIETGRAVEGDLRPEDCRAGFLLGNSLRGLVPARLLPPRPEGNEGMAPT
ncbi:aminodeoxychorismate synthase component I [Sphingomonas cannabina]|uniref:aminodeoxychorismate synthase component I n=1 Tax=Sphingomonas cannabina TaxID=2899123 RepID=UPI001F1A72C9|nr:aminodeoxychorismate synthase component I [Sphingomonas cannabina]UIJ46967.1 aminodeoxychorismate synthase component I [Sphingomonas cannabina]